MDVEEGIRLATMKQTLMRQATAVCEDSRIDIDLDQSVLILLKHCQSMKQQETRLRLITLLLLLSCTALFVFTTIRRQENLEPSRQGSTAVQSPAYSKQERECLADDHQRLRIHLREASTHDYQQETTNGLYIKWDLVFGEYYDEEKQAIVIPKDGIYFVYVRMLLTCFGKDDETNSQSFNVEIHKWNEGYQKNVVLAKIWDGIVCTPEGSRTVFVGQLFDLSADDRVSVWIGNGSRLIARSFFGAYLV
ncbi:uncharacterized protein V6R79_010294 [Siganus canaliculatus]